MKIRIKANTVRFRLSKSEVDKLAEEGYLADKTEFPGSTFIYAVQQTDEDHLSAGFSNNTITLCVPKNHLQSWAGSNKISIDSHFSSPGNTSLYLLLEKDFKCIDSDVTKDQSDFFDHPLKTC